MRELGTIFMSSTELEADKIAGDRARVQFEATARRVFQGYREAREDGELRFYASASVYGVLGRDGLPKWFEVRADGHTYALKSQTPRTY